LEFFVKKAGRALTRDEILNAVWGYDCVVTPRSIDRFVTTLRNKIEPNPHLPKLIRTIREVGYKFEPAETEQSADG
jgi:two-component system alkaline phosphatase synthesis response regulator PhoP